MRRIAAVLALVLLAGCSKDTAPVAATSTTAPQEAQVRIGDVVVHASVVQTSMLDASIAREYGLERSDRTAMLLVSARNPNGDAPPSPVDISATVTPANGAPQPIALREVNVGGLVDHVGTIDIAPPETLKFEVRVRYGSATSTLQFTRDFFPR
ncbi:DUF4426 domain-containing protein [Lysobacter sp. TY2-98]|uniref:DUF4426 domain-containing protein n=1 Tax=Lysobacter sp. TY2-98 TaxID=2290922 RepID=UPI000E208789|nr:DUF4426 domain-containing protein [Lysobacter sp. TY2-98]AXK71377.1 DUF4426 domain-containing protein [Lysobacter sp. TY2-98]